MPTSREPKSSSRTSGSAANGKANGSADVESVSSALLGGIQQKVTSRVDQQKNRAADGLGEIADLIRGAGDELRNDNETLASYVDMASDQMRRFANQIRERGVADMMQDVDRFARRRPALFIGGAFLAGLGIARFLKSTADRADDRGYGRGYRRAYGSSFSSVDPMTAGTGSPTNSGDRGETGNY